MLIHTALFTLKTEFDGRDKAANLEMIVENVRTMAREISFARSIEVGRQHDVASVSFPACDIAVEARLETDADYAAYVAHPAHQKARDFAAAVSDSVSVITFVSEV